VASLVGGGVCAPAEAAKRSAELAAAPRTIFMIMNFDISEDKAYEIRKQLEAKRGKA
jgi:hypothetical protein